MTNSPESIFNLTAAELSPTLYALDQQGVTTEHLKALRSNNGNNDYARRVGLSFTGYEHAPLTPENTHVPLTQWSKILQFAGSFNAGSCQKFVAKDRFRDSPASGSVWVRNVDANFTKHFLPKIEKNVPAAMIVQHAVIHDARHLPQAYKPEPGIIPELCGHHCISLAHLFQAVVQTSKTGAWGFSPVIGYVTDQDGSLWSIEVYGDGDYPNGRHVRAKPIDDPECRIRAGECTILSQGPIFTRYPRR